MAFRIGMTRELLRPDGRPVWPGLGIDGLENEPDLEIEFLPERVRHATPELIGDYDALFSSTLIYDTASFAGIRRLALVARFGVGYDTIDTSAATAAGVMITITRGAPDRPVAEGALALMLAIGHQVVMKDRITREGRWTDRHTYMGVELRDRTLGLVGYGGIGRELHRLVRVFRPARVLVYDPHVAPEAVHAAGAIPVSLDELLRHADFVSIHCPLTPETRGLIGARELALMKPTAFLINTARGPIVDQPALALTLAERRIRGAALDVFQEEPIPATDPLLSLENVIVAPHAVALTEELYRDYHRCCVQQALALKHGRLPPHLVNPEVLRHPRIQARVTAG